MDLLRGAGICLHSSSQMNAVLTDLVDAGGGTDITLLALGEVKTHVHIDKQTLALLASSLRNGAAELVIQPDAYGGDLFSRDQQVICIIGAGPAGLAALKIILDTPQYKSGLWKPIAFEARERVGGVWLPAPPVDDPPITPLYDSLTTNLPHPVMAFTSYSFPPSTPVFPHASVVHEYLEDYANHFGLLPFIRLGTSVEAVERQTSKWHLKLSTKESVECDLLIVCNGHYRVPRYPAIPGLDEWLRIGKASHSAWYRHPRDFGETVLVIGAGPSGQDISAEMRQATRTVVHSVNGAVHEDIGNLKRRGRVVQFGDGGKVTFEDGSTEASVDHCILATGYEMSFPFLPPELLTQGLPPPVPPLPRELYNSTYSVFPLARHIFPLQAAFPPTSLAFLGLLSKVAPFPLVEAQARAVVHAFATPEALNTTQEAIDIVARYEALRLKTNDSLFAIWKLWHKFDELDELEQFDYRDSLCEFAGADVRGMGYMKVPEWEKEMYERKGTLRRAWAQLKANGEAEEWVRGVGEGGTGEWVQLLRKILTWADEHGIDSATDKPKL